MLPEIRLPDFDDETHEGIRIAGCRLLRLLEDGGTTRSYVANYLETSLVVVKLFDDRLIRASSELADMYEWECEMLLNIRHKSLPVTVRFGHRPDLGCRYLVQEYVFGEPLARVKRNLGRAMTPGEAADTLKPIADALVMCHAQGISHGHISAVHVILQEGDPLPVPRLVGLRPNLGPLAATDTDDAFALSALAYALTAPEGAAPISAVQDGHATVGFKNDAAWGEVLTMGLTSQSETRMLDLRDGLADVLETDPCMHRRTRALAKAVVPLRPPDEQLPTNIDAVDFEQIDPDPISVIDKDPPRSDREEIITAPTTLWQSPEGTYDDAVSDVVVESEPIELGVDALEPLTDAIQLDPEVYQKTAPLKVDFEAEDTEPETPRSVAVPAALTLVAMCIMGAGAALYFG